MSEINFLKDHIDFDDYTNCENWLDYELGFLKGLQSALKACDNLDPVSEFIGKGIEKRIDRQKKMLLLYLEGFDE